MFVPTLSVGTRDNVIIVKEEFGALANEVVAAAPTLTPHFEGIRRPETQSDMFASLVRWRGPIIAFLALSLVTGIYYVTVKGESRSAINRWRPVLHRLVEGDDIYLRFGFPTPPPMALILYPFATLPGKLAMATWFIAKVGLTVIVLVWLFQQIDRCRPLAPTWIGYVVMALSAGPIMGDLLHGNVNLWILFLMVGSLHAFSRGRDVLSGLLLGLAISCRLTPALLAILFAWKKAWRAVGAASLALAVFLLLIPSLFLGFSRNVTLLRHWADYMVWPYVAGGQVETRQINHSLPALVYRLTTASVAIQLDGKPVESINVVEWSSAAAAQLVGVLTIGVLIGLARFCARTPHNRGQVEFLHEASLVLIAMLLLSERSWKHHYVTLLPSFAVLVATTWRYAQSHATKASSRQLVCALAGSFVLMTAASQDLVDPLFGEGAADRIEACASYVWAAILLAAAHVRCIANGAKQ